MNVFVSYLCKMTSGRLSWNVYLKSKTVGVSQLCWLPFCWEPLLTSFRGFRVNRNISHRLLYESDGEWSPLGSKAGSRMSWPPLQSDHLEPFHTTLPPQCQQDIPSWDTRRFSCLVQHALLSASFIWNAKRGATGGSVSPRIKELLWRVPLFCFFVSVCVSVCERRRIHETVDHYPALQINLRLLSLASSSWL